MIEPDWNTIIAEGAKKVVKDTRSIEEQIVDDIYNPKISTIVINGKDSSQPNLTLTKKFILYNGRNPHAKT